MKQKIIIKDTNNNTIIEGEKEIRDLSHLKSQQINKSHVFKPSKGKGSFRRRPKHQSKQETEN